MKINQHGLTLVEVLATIVLASFILITLFGILSNGEKEIKQQRENNRQLVDTTFIFKVLSNDIRKNPNSLSITEDVNGDFEYLEINSIKYELDSNNQLLKGSQILANNIEKFEVKKDSNTVQITIKLFEEEEKTIELVLR